MKKKRNKKYNPNNHRKDPLAFDLAIRLVQPVEDGTKAELLKDVDAALTAFENGVAMKSHFDSLASMVDVSLLLLNDLFADASEYQATVKQGWLGMVRTRDRFIKTGKLGMDGPALTAVKAASDIYEVIIGNLIGVELLNYYKRRQETVRSGNYFKGTFEELKRAA